MLDVFETSSRHLGRRKIVTLKTCWRRLQDMSSRRLQDMSSRRLGRRKIVTLKTCWRRLQDMFWRRPQHALKINKCLLCPYYKALWSKSKKTLTLRKINSFYILNDTIRIEINENEFEKHFPDIALSPSRSHWASKTFYVYIIFVVFYYHCLSMWYFVLLWHLLTDLKTNPFLISPDQFLWLFCKINRISKKINWYLRKLNFISII